MQEVGAAALIIAKTDDTFFQLDTVGGKEGECVVNPVWLIGAKDSMTVQERLNSALIEP